MKMTDEQRSLSRRTLLKGTAAGTASLVAGSALGPTVLHGRVRAQEKTTVRLSGNPSSPEETRLLEQVLAEFEAQFPNIQVDFEPVSQQYFEKLQTDLAAGTAADVFYVDSMPLPDLASRGVLLELDAYMSEAAVKPEDFYPGLIQAFQFGGKTYGLPKDWSSLATVYDPTVFSDAGVDAAPATWDDLRAAGQAVLDATGQPGIILPPDFARFIAFLYQAGGAVLNPENTQILIDSPETRQALEFYYGLYEEGLAATHSDVGAQWPGDAFAKDLGSVVFEGNWMFPFLEANAPDKEVGIAEMPAGPGGKATMAFTVSYSINARTQVADAAWEVVNFMTGPVGMKSWTDLGLAMPARPALAADWIAKFPEREAYLAGGDYARPWQLGPGGQVFFQDANATLEAVFAGQMDVEEAVTQMAADGQENITLTPQ